MTNTIMQFIGEKPSNPLIYESDKWVYYLGEIVEIEPYVDPFDEEAVTVPRWQAELLERVPLSVYYERERARITGEISLSEARCNTNAYELMLLGGL